MNLLSHYYWTCFLLPMVFIFSTLLIAVVGKLSSSISPFFASCTVD